MFVAAYWWDVRPGKEEQFRAAWRRGTELIREIYGSLGSRLHREDRDDGKIRYVGIAEWPDRETWQKAFDAKMAENERKYPVDKARGSSRKYTDYEK